MSDRVNRVLVQPRDSKAIVQALEQLIGDRAYLEKLRRNAYATAQRYSWQLIAKNTLAVYENALLQRQKS